MTEITCFSRCQGPFQAVVRPGQWCFGVRALRQGREAWACRSDKAALFRALQEAIPVWQAQGLMGTRKVRLGKINLDNGFMRIENYTQGAEWLDVVELHVTAETDGSVEVRVKSFSSGFIPTMCPLGPLFSMACCWFPFADITPEGEHLNSLRIAAMRETLTSRGLAITRTDV